MVRASTAFVCWRGQLEGDQEPYILVVEEVEDGHAWHALLAIPACAITARACFQGLVQMQRLHALIRNLSA